MRQRSRDSASAWRPPRCFAAGGRSYGRSSMRSGFLIGSIRSCGLTSSARAVALAEQIDEADAFERTVSPFRGFMLGHVREQDLELFMEIAGETEVATPDDISIQTLIPAFMISELRRAFEIGFLIFLPFLIIDMVVASVLMSMGMMMLPPVMISLPFKLIFFVLVDGWYLVAGSLVQSFG